MFVDAFIASALCSAMSAQLQAESALRQAELQRWLMDEELRIYKRAGSIEVEARVITDPLLIEFKEE